MKLTGESRSCDSPLFSLVSHNITRRSESGYGSGRSTTRSSSVNTAVVAPMPSPSASTAATVKPGLRRSRRNPKRISWRTVSMTGLDGRTRSKVGELLAERMCRDQQVLDEAAADQVLVNDALERRRIAPSIPCPFGVDKGDGPAFADAEAIGLCPQNSALFGESQLL